MADASRSLWVQLGLNSSGYQAGISSAIGSTQSLQSSISGLNARMADVSKRMTSVGKSMTKVGSKMSKYVTLPLAVAGGAAVKFAADFETAMVEVQKVTDATTADKLSGSIRRMAKTIPLAQNELAGLAADAARFGVRGVENIESFTESVAKMAEATDLSATHAGEALAKIAQQANVPVPEIENLGSAINELSNNFATSSSEIVDAMLRSSATMSNFGLQATEIAGLSAQMNAMSESAERAGTRLRNLFQSLMDPKKVKEIAGALGMTAQEFKAMRRENPAEVVMMLTQAMADGGKTADNLRSVLGRTARTALTALAKNTDDVTRAMNMSADAYRENTSLQKEFDAATNTFNARLKLLGNRARDLGISIGKTLIPYVEALVSKVEKGIKWFKGLSDRTKKITLAVAGLAAVVGPLTVALGGVITAVGRISTALGGVITAVGRISTALSGMTGPIGLVIAAASALTVGIVALSNATNEAEARQRRMNRAVRQATKPLRDEQAELAVLKDRLKGASDEIDYHKEALNNAEKGTTRYKISQEKLSSAENNRKEIIKKLNDKYGDYLENNIKISDSYETIKTKLEGVNTQLKERIALKATEAKKTQTLKEATDVYMKIDEQEKKIEKTEKNLAAAREGNSQLAMKTGAMYERNLEDQRERLEELRSTYDELLADHREYTQKASELRSEFGLGDMEDDAGQKAGQKAGKSAVENARRFAGRGIEIPAMVDTMGFDGLDNATNKLAKINSQMRMMSEGAPVFKNILQDAFSGMQNAITNAFNNSQNILQSFWKFFINMIQGMIAKLIAAALATLALAAAMALIVPGSSAGGFVGYMNQASKMLGTQGITGGLMGLESGGVVTSPGTFLVGEDGPELATLDRGTAVTPNSALTSRPADNNINVTLDWEMRGDNMYAIVKQIERKKGNTL